MLNQDKKFTWVEFKINGQCPSGKNAVVVTRSGHRFPSKRFVVWRTDAIAQLQPQLQLWEEEGVQFPFTEPVFVSVDYYAKDRIRRDAPGIIDAIWHLLERAGIVSDDTLLSGFSRSLHFSNHGLDKNNARVVIKLGVCNADSCEPKFRKKPKIRTRKQTFKQ